MKTSKRIQLSDWFLVFMIMLCTTLSGITQYLINPDSLEDVTVSGTIYVDTSGSSIRYLLDEGSDGFMDYRVHFGPLWYQPAEGDAVRPQDGDEVIIAGGLNTDALGNLPSLFVYEINGEFWRDPYESYWNQLNEDYTAVSLVYPEGSGICILDSLDQELIAGVVLADSSFLDIRYFLDTDFDGLPDYKLNFGPPWYVPQSNVSYPEDGDFVEISGIIVHVSVYPVIVVIALDGTVWRDLNGFMNYGQGRWMNGQSDGAEVVYSPFDTGNKIQFRPGWHHQGLPGSMYCQLLQTNLHGLPAWGPSNSKGLAAFNVGWFNQNRLNLMKQNQHRMHLNNLVRIRLHYTDGQLARAGIQKQDRLRLNGWDEVASRWVELEGVQYDPSTNSLEFETNVVYAYYLLVKDESTTTTVELQSAPMRYCIYPNPVRQVANIRWEMEESQPVVIRITNLTGQRIHQQEFQLLPAGINEFQYQPDAGLTNGIYILEIITPEDRMVMKWLWEH